MYQCPKQHCVARINMGTAIWSLPRPSALNAVLLYFVIKNSDAYLMVGEAKRLLQLAVRRRMSLKTNVLLMTT